MKKYLMKEYYLIVLIFLSAAQPLFSATTDNNVEWPAVYHSPTLEVDSKGYSYRSSSQNVIEANVDNDDEPWFRLRVYKGDVTAVYLRMSSNGWSDIAMNYSTDYNDGTFGWCDIYDAKPVASVIKDKDPGTNIIYNFKVVDGTDVDYYKQSGMQTSDVGGTDFSFTVEGITAVPTSVKANGSEKSTISVWVTDNGTPAPYVLVTFSSTGSATFVDNTIYTDANGKAMAEVLNSVAQSVTISVSDTGNYLTDSTDSTVTVVFSSFIIDGSDTDWSGTAGATTNSYTISNSVHSP